MRRYLQALLLLVLGLAIVKVVIWVADWIDDYRSPPPVKVVRQLLDALRNDDCSRALTYFSAQSRSALAPAKPGSSSRFRYCWPQAQKQFSGLYPPSARLGSQTAGRAKVSIEHYASDPKSFLVPGFWPTRSIVTTVTIDLVEEAGEAWRVVVRQALSAHNK